MSKISLPSLTPQNAPRARADLTYGGLITQALRTAQAWTDVANTEKCGMWTERLPPRGRRGQPKFRRPLFMGGWGRNAGGSGQAYYES